MTKEKRTRGAEVDSPFIAGLKEPSAHRLVPLRTIHRFALSRLRFKSGMPRRIFRSF
jgi:hypothetical protein